MTHPWTRPPTSWPALADELVVALLRLPADRTLDLLTAGPALTAAWLLPDRVALSLQPLLDTHLPALRARGWAGTRRCVDGHDPASTARAAAREAVAVLRDVAGARPDGVELWWPCTPSPDPAPAPTAAWRSARARQAGAEPWW